MRSSPVRFSTALLVVLLSTGVLASSALAIDRDRARRDPDNPITRVIEFLKHLVRTFDDQISVPKP